MFESCITPVLTPERLAMELMMLVAILHGNIGSEVGKYLLMNSFGRVSLRNNWWNKITVNHCV